MVKSGFRDSQQSFPDGSRGTPKPPPPPALGLGEESWREGKVWRLGAGLEVGSDFVRVEAGSWAPSRFGD